jgi:preprotein translocase subunit SecF
VPFQIIKPGTHIDFLGKWRICVAVSTALVVVGLVGIPLRGFRLGIDFAGGTEVQVRFLDAGGVDEGDIREVVDDLGIPNPSVTRFGGPDSQEFLIKFRGGREAEAASAGEGAPAAAPEASKGQNEPAAAPEASKGQNEPAAAPEASKGENEPAAAPGASEGEKAKKSEGEKAKTDRVMALESTLEQKIGPLEIERVEFVGPKVGAELREDGLKAIGIACLLILIYIGFRFSARFAPGAVVALIHDVLITASIWIVLGLEFDLRVLAALLAIIGYSLNDTIIVYDRIRENMELRTKLDLKEVLNRSVNQTLSRTLLTSLTTLAAVLSLLVLGGEVIRPFALAMAIGIVVGTYSSIYIASPSLLWLETRFGAGSSGPRAVPREATKREATKREATKRETTKRESGKGEAAKPESGKGEAAKREAAKRRPPKATKKGSRRRRRSS